MYHRCMLRKFLITLALAIAVAVLSSCAFGFYLKSEELVFSQAQKDDIKAMEEKKAEDKEGKKNNNNYRPPVRPVPQISEDTLFTLIYLLGRDRHDKRRAVILDLEEDGIEIIPTVPDFEYEILQSVSVAEAIYETEIFFGHQDVITNYYFKTVFGPNGNIIGYEIRPTYVESLYGSFDPLEIKYKYNRRRVSVSIGLKKGL